MDTKEEILKKVKEITHKIEFEGQAREPAANHPSGEYEYLFLTFANRPGIFFEADVQRSQIMKNGESKEEFVNRYHQDDEKRVEVCFALRKLINCFITDKKLKDSDELKYSRNYYYFIFFLTVK